MIQALPDEFFFNLNDIDLIIGQPLLFNHYSIWDVESGRIGFYQGDYT